MACAYDPDLGDDAGVELRSLGLGTTVRLWNRVRPWDDELIQICVELVAGKVHGAVHGVTLLGTTAITFTSYFDDLVESFRGWEGVRTWETADRDLRVDAEYTKGGRINMTWTIAPVSDVRSVWSVSMSSTVQAGEDMVQLGTAVYRLVRPADD